MRQKIRIAHSPDSDDAFMFYGLAEGKMDPEGFEFEHILSDIQTLNQKAMEGIYEVTAISIHAYPYVCDKYILLNSGASMGEGYGPMIVARDTMTHRDFLKRTIAVPGELTTAFLALKIFAPEVKTQVVPFDEIMPGVKEGQYEAGLIIHEGQLTYGQEGLKLFVDLGQWWQEKTGLPLPLGGNVIRRDLGGVTHRRLDNLLKRSVQYSLEHKKEGVAYSMKYAGGMSEVLTDKFVGMYVNHWTVDYGDRGREAVARILHEGNRCGLIPRRVQPEFVS
ncbi:MAG: ABC transporter substrate-binding protein [Deltaproteobacteria bacterium RIFCSPLOWO2_02_FULL_50_16]|nr:MAG: ABC transporter substrate-binding protein [Deltaproteobacteria bacterium GWA2_50_8]OGQ26776.1 MAG: ABC transporter substrate-binding protein [Deltaproteobacteria bacterium RIFCSPHIGHO2_02_FULL_50_15]OGQ57057.1 MAG: ABC transporter substrate-binding protein [Deltaproteobacteria bacterium RIFCSPLOWO2_02_FULL_50_16]OGQ66895.1 MAG: ABC transporter substrate-binding protein [Deltaproteobacteria bacterium RIFCSPLOWO2_12_FULL_50_11]